MTVEKLAGGAARASGTRLGELAVTDSGRPCAGHETSNSLQTDGHLGLRRLFRGSLKIDTTRRCLESPERRAQLSCPSSWLARNYVGTYSTRHSSHLKLLPTSDILLESNPPLSAPSIRHYRAAFSRRCTEEPANPSRWRIRRKHSFAAAIEILRSSCRKYMDVLELAVTKAPENVRFAVATCAKGRGASIE